MNGKSWPTVCHWCTCRPVVESSSHEGEKEYVSCTSEGCEKVRMVWGNAFDGQHNSNVKTVTVWTGNELVIDNWNSLGDRERTSSTAGKEQKESEGKLRTPCSTSYEARGVTL